ncbi:hypothetical protein TELCIR_14200 [Teladorsagia circumcincta]|uniref:Peptide chain release factor domain-containing protein n=1 Tax=Teladorsagia circumcincta TaxID=45464 RepID=A0A2G9U1N4_TELCI|nr:hypothetical protein TELCIR_14200 [Teladorsagia circumcincta]
MRMLRRERKRLNIGPTFRCTGSVAAFTQGKCHDEEKLGSYEPHVPSFSFLYYNPPSFQLMRISRSVFSSVRTILAGQKATAFVDTVTSRLAAHRSGTAAGGERHAAYWDGICRAAQLTQQKRNEIEQIRAMAADSSDAELRTMAEEERQAIEESLASAEQELVDSIVPVTEIDVLRKCQIEFTRFVSTSYR